MGGGWFLVHGYDMGYISIGCQWLLCRTTSFCFPVSRRPCAVPILRGHVSGSTLGTGVLTRDRPQAAVSFCGCFRVTSPGTAHSTLCRLFATLGIFKQICLTRRNVGTRVDMPTDGIRAFHTRLCTFSPTLRNLHLGVTLSSSKGSF